MQDDRVTMESYGSEVFGFFFFETTKKRPYTFDRYLFFYTRAGVRIADQTRNCSEERRGHFIFLLPLATSVIEDSASIILIFVKARSPYHSR